jgi:hypothetical protein
MARGTRGGRPANAVDPGMARLVVELDQTTYRSFNHQTSDPERDGGRVSHERVASGQYRGRSGTWRAVTQPRRSLARRPVAGEREHPLQVCLLVTTSV